ncbi:OpgC domain-containing protein [Sinorhizobium medicae]|uniref:OpgC domain-containing protein n=1 Tax=Sinorhizobium medicae TaxID=110321 RepID=UPI001AAE8A14|nr:OpgC domain-containing protein [Sinorhizobium medicae]WQP42050.1 OpgC domain-containing protein [Sinorhizobium medicae]
MRMLTKTPSESTPAATAIAGKRVRDPRLDAFRGIGMLIILVAHVPNDPWALWIPARFGFSDASEMFVFLSGMASAIAFGRLFDRQGLGLLTARVVHRCWQIYWAHIVVFLTVATIMAAAGNRPDSTSYIESLNLVRFFEDPGPLLVGLMTLTYVPNYFDILPMYMVILALMPVMLMAERVATWLPFVLMAALWLSAQFGLAHFPAEPWSDRPWFFDPFGWQFVFFLGFFLMRGTIKLPVGSRPLLIVSTAFVLVAVPFAWHVILSASPFFRETAHAIGSLTSKTDFGILRLLHFLALAQIAMLVVGEKGRRLHHPRIRPLTAVLIKVGQQSLPVFMTGMVVAQLIGIALDHAGRGPLPVAIANLAGFTILVATAYAAAWFKQVPWKT